MFSTKSTDTDEKKVEAKHLIFSPTNAALKHWVSTLEAKADGSGVLDNRAFRNLGVRICTVDGRVIHEKIHETHSIKLCHYRDEVRRLGASLRGDVFGLSVSPDEDAKMESEMRSVLSDYIDGDSSGIVLDYVRDGVEFNDQFASGGAVLGGIGMMFLRGFPGEQMLLTRPSKTLTVMIMWVDGYVAILIGDRPLEFRAANLVPIYDCLHKWRKERPADVAAGDELP
jgi:hypothetical protein